MVITTVIKSSVTLYTAMTLDIRNYILSNTAQFIFALIAISQ